MLQETNLLQQMNGAPVTTNRFHYINFHLPDTFRRMLQHCESIVHDYSMCYGTINGFRAGSSRPYRWYNLVSDQSTSLIIHPTAWMDANCIFEEKLNPEESLKQLLAMCASVKAAGGDFVTIFHNHFIGRDENGRQWWNVYERFLASIF